MEPPITDEQIVAELKQMHLRYLEDIKAMVVELIDLPAPADEKVADIIGHTREVEVLLAEWRRGMVKEATSEGEAVEGSAYRVSVGHKATRTFNTAAILHAASQGRPLDVTLRDMMAEKAVKVEFPWQPRGGGGIKQYFIKRGLELRIVGREIADDGDLDAPHIGEVWSDTTSLEGKREDG